MAEGAEAEAADLAADGAESAADVAPGPAADVAARPAADVAPGPDDALFGYIERFAAVLVCRRLPRRCRPGSSSPCWSPTPAALSAAETSRDAADQPGGRVRARCGT